MAISASWLPKETTLGESSLIGVQVSGQVVMDLVPKISWEDVGFSNETEKLKNKHTSILLKCTVWGVEEESRISQSSGTT